MITIVITLEIHGPDEVSERREAAEHVDAVLDGGALQDAVNDNEHGLMVTSATCTVRPKRTA